MNTAAEHTHGQDVQATAEGRRKAPRIEDVEAPVVGRLYDVPVVYGNGRSAPLVPKGYVVPIIGPLHEDREVIGFNYDHWHCDVRFLEPRMKMQRAWDRSADGDWKWTLARPINLANTTGVVGRAVRKMRREMPVFPANTSATHEKWHRALEEMYGGMKLKCAVCPHRGISLKGLKADENGVVVCPGHGLAWDKATGALVRR